MNATYVEPVVTKLTLGEAIACMRQGIHVATGTPPSDPALALALAKTALETGRWQKMWNYNWGNVKCNDDYDGMYTCFPCNEVLNGKVVWFSPQGQLTRKDGDMTGLAWAVPPGHPQTRFRAYANGFDGAQQYAEFVANGRYRDAWERLLEGDPAGYVHALKLRGYFTADEDTYLRGVDRLYREFLPRVEEASKAFRSELDTLDDSIPPAPSDTEPSGPPDSQA